jgi:hypothetical protein
MLSPGTMIGIAIGTRMCFVALVLDHADETLDLVLGGEQAQFAWWAFPNKSIRNLT